MIWPPTHYRRRPHNVLFHRTCDRPDISVAWFCGGVGSGKTVAGMVQLYWHAVGLAPGGYGLLVVPEFKTFWRVIVPRAHMFWPKGSWQVDTRHADLKLLVNAGGGRTTTIWVASAKDARTVESLEGPDVDFAHLEEPSSMHAGKIAFEKVLARLRGQTGKARKITICGKPKGFNWLTEVFGIETEFPPEAWTTGIEPKPGYWVRAVKTTENPTLPPDYYARMVDAYGEQFAKQELEGAIVAAEGRVLGNYYRSVHMIPSKLADDLFHATSYRSGGVDWGFRNPAALVWGGWDGDGNKVVQGEWYCRGKTAEEQGVVARDLQRRLKVEDWYCGPDRPENLHKWSYGYELDGELVVLDGINKGIREPEARYDSIRALLDVRGVGELDHPAHEPGNRLGRPGILFSDHCTNLDSEMIQLRYEELKPGQIVGSDKVVGDNHAVEALGYDTLAYQRAYSVVPQQV